MIRKFNLFIEYQIHSFLSTPQVLHLLWMAKLQRSHIELTL